MIVLRFRETFFDEDWTTAVFSGPQAEPSSNVLAAALLRRDFDVEIADEDGDFAGVED